MGGKNTNGLAGWLSAVGEPTRLRIIRALATGAKNVTETAKLLNTEIANVSHHLRVLRRADVVRNEQHGRHVVYSLATPPEVLPGGTVRLTHGPTGAVVELPPEVA